MARLITREDKVKPKTRFNPNSFVEPQKEESKKKAKVKYSSLRCTETTKNKINALVSTNDFENIEDCLKHMLAAYEATMSNEKIQEYEIIQKILERKSNK
ncbi:hypothetical protein IGK74_002344 [Enterococcus sp. AZ150]|uniref:hypothetical protein n=1 Tax=Enterococcus sp. AZ150 TaxID=2774866 RepID=UPI003F25DCF7